MTLIQPPPQPPPPTQQHPRQSARKRIESLLDKHSFTEFEALRRINEKQATGVIGGSGTIHGRRVFLYAQDFSVSGGAVGAENANKVVRLIEAATRARCPIIALNDSGGARIQEGASSLDGYGRIFRAQVAASGVVPQISVVLGPCAGGAAYSPALADFTFMVEGISYMYLTGPSVVEAVTGESVTHHELGGPSVHGTASGLAAMVYPDEESCLEDVRFLIYLLPSYHGEMRDRPSSPTRADVRPRLASLAPKSNTAYDMMNIITELTDDGEFFELFPDWAHNVIIGLGRFGGLTTGIVASQPAHLTGALDATASDKAARFVRFCSAFGIPLLTLVDVPGFMPGPEQESAGIIRRGAKLLHAYCDAYVPRIQVIIRKAFGGAYIVMDSRSIGCDVSLAWPDNQVAVMGAAAAVEIIHRRELEIDSSRKGELAGRYEDEVMHPYAAAERGFVDDIIEPDQTRIRVIRALSILIDKQSDRPLRAHGNIPL